MNTPKMIRPIQHMSHAPNLGDVVRVLYQGHPLCYGGDVQDANGLGSCGTVTKVTPMYVWVKCTHGTDIKVARGDNPNWVTGFTTDITSP